MGYIVCRYVHWVISWLIRCLDVNQMSLTRAFRKLQAAHPNWSYRQLANELKTTDNYLRAINGKLKLPVPVRPKADPGKSKRALGINKVYEHKAVTKRFKKERAIIAPAQQGSGRKQYGSYLKLL